MRYRTTSRRTAATAALVEGFFALMWFGWGQAAPPAWESVVLGVGSGVAFVIVVLAAMTVWRVRAEPSPIAGPAEGRRFGIIVGIEFTLAAVGAAVLGGTGHAGYIVAWVALVVGVHFVPLNRVFPGVGMVGLAVAVSAVAVVAALVGLTTSVPPSSVAGLGVGVVLAVHAASLLVAARQLRGAATGRMSA